MTDSIQKPSGSQNAVLWSKRLFVGLALTVLPVAIGIYFMGLYDWDWTIPLVYEGGDDGWQLVLTKVLRDTGWILYNPYLGAPDIASWHHNAAAQTSALHSVIMLFLSVFISDAVALQETYFVLNFALIALSAYVACRLMTIGQVPSVAVGLLFSFSTFRFNAMHYSFISNYFTTPLALVPAFYILCGRYADVARQGSAALEKIKALLTARIFWLGLVFVVMAASSDGYLAFFLLLIFGFCFLIRLISGAVGHPVELFAPISYIFSIITVSILLQAPIIGYKEVNRDEFYPGGVLDSTLSKHPFEAEVYSSSLKMLLAPSPENRFDVLTRLGGYMLASSEEARKYQNGPATAPLGMTAALILIASLTLLMAPAARCRMGDALSRRRGTDCNTQIGAFLSLILFSVFCSIIGGIGSLVALVYPTIRAYDRFPIILQFMLLAAAAYVITCLISRMVVHGRIVVYFVLFPCVILAILDQTPRSVDRRSAEVREKFLTERIFISQVEKSVHPGAMIYQYPHSQYLKNSDYYGWGSFAHVRLYLHSKQLHWSNGASKNSPVEAWHMRVAALPFERMLAEVQSAGFAGMVIDRSVVPDDEYQHLVDAAARNGIVAVDDPGSSLAFVGFAEPNLKIEYAKNFREADRLIVADASAIDMSNLPAVIDPVALKRWVEAYSGKGGFTVSREKHPDLFTDLSTATRGDGDAPVTPLEALEGNLVCRKVGEELEVTLNNQSPFNLTLKSGSFPFAFGVHIRSKEGEVLRFDNGLRFPLKSAEPPALGKRKQRIIIEKQKSASFRFPLSAIDLSGLASGGLEAEFALVQDGNAWFNNFACSVNIDR